MKIFAKIPTKKEQGDGWSRYPEEVLIVDVVRVLRYRCDRNRERYYYEADILQPMQIHPDAARFCAHNGMMRVNINRRLNPKWKPPIFKNGRESLKVESA